jgi:hypothetical protein
MSSRFIVLIAASALIVMMAFPKAGFYYEGIPVTVGYIVLGLLAVFELIHKATHNKSDVGAPVAFILVFIFGFGAIEVGAFKIYGYASVGGAIAIVVSTLLVPVLSFLATCLLLRVLGTSGYVSALRWSLAIVLTYGLVSFFAFNIAGIAVGVPYVTTTGSDLAFVYERHNMRDNFVKMFSTYNNGNILGVNLLLWGPIAAVGTRYSLFSSIAFRTGCLLTLSRSAWAGLMIYEMLCALKDRSLARVYRAFFAVALLLLAVILVSLLIGHDPLKFLLDRDFNGRLSSFESQLEVVSQRKIAWEGESIYGGAYLAFGAIGVIMVLVIWLVPIIFGGKDPLQRTARVACLTYLIVGVIEGAFVLVPTQAVYWGVASLALMKLPETSAVRENV